MADEEYENGVDEEQEYTDDTDVDDGEQDRRVARSNGQDVAVRERSVGVRGFNPLGAIRAGHLRLARSWAENGSVYAATAAYMEIVRCYPGSGAARAATEGLLELAHSLEQNGMYYTAQNIFRQLEQAWE